MNSFPPPATLEPTCHPKTAYHEEQTHDPWLPEWCLDG